ncbi:ABC transporter permease [Providencia vermicola]|nr:ABC transporter permease [Providencia sp. G1(2023)]MBC8652442.1 ABC transporter permease [Providencia vermicola]
MANWQKLRPQSVEGWLIWVIIIMVVFFTAMSPQFLTIQNLLDLSESYAVTGVFALGLFVVLVTGGIDISFAAVASVVQYVIATWLLQGIIASPALSITLAIVIGIAFGLINAILIYSLNVVSIIITISMQSLLFGMLMWLTNGHSIYDLPDWWVDPVTILPFEVDGEYYQVGLPLLVMLGIAFLTCMSGSNINATWFSGIRTDRVMIAIYTISSLLCVLAGLIMMARFNSARMGYGDSYLLLTILAIVLGGTNPFGGVGKVSRVFCALLVLQVIATGLSLLGVSLHFNLAVWGITLILALAFKFFKERWSAKRAMTRNQRLNKTSPQS